MAPSARAEQLTMVALPASSRVSRGRLPTRAASRPIGMGAAALACRLSCSRLVSCMSGLKMSSACPAD
jgi:hypothetical protein